MRAFIALVLAGGCGGASPQPPVRFVEGEVFGSTWSVKWVERGTPVSEDAVRAEAAVVFDAIDRGVSTWRADSDLSRARAAGHGVPVSGDTAAVVSAALSLAAATEGAFDPTVQPLVELWTLHGERRTTAPTDAEIEAAKAQVGWQRVALRWVDGAASLDLGGTALDLSALAPGYAADRLADALAGLGVVDVLVDVGGEVLARGRSASGGPWRLGIDRPVEGTAPGESLYGVVNLWDRAIGTSGSYRNHYEVDGVWVGNAIDPRTGRPAAAHVGSVSVVAPDAASADGWATALMVLGPEGLGRLGAHPEIDALMLLPRRGEAGWEERQTDGMARWR